MGSGKGQAKRVKSASSIDPYVEHSEWLSGWAMTHDYDPTWDYDVIFKYRKHELLSQAQESLNIILNDNKGQFSEARVYPVDLSDTGALGMYVYGTRDEPVILVDIDNHIALSNAPDVDASPKEIIIDTVIHELRHAYQEQNELDFDEIEAEHGSSRIPF